MPAANGIGVGVAFGVFVGVAVGNELFRVVWICRVQDTTGRLMVVDKS